MLQGSVLVGLLSQLLLKTPKCIFLDGVVFLNFWRTCQLPFLISLLESIKDTSILAGLKLNLLILLCKPALPAMGSVLAPFFQLIQPKTLESSWFFSFSPTLHVDCQQICYFVFKMYPESCLPNKAMSSVPFPTSAARTFVRISRTSCLNYCNSLSFLLLWLPPFNLLSV